MEYWNGRIALVTGASVGVGQEVCRLLVKQGMTVIGCGRRVEKIRALAEDSAIKSAPGKLVPVRCDLAKETEILGMFAFIEGEYAALSLFVDTASCSIKTTAFDGKSEDWRNMLNVNVLAFCICVEQSIRLMRKKNDSGSQIIHVSSLLFRTLCLAGPLDAASSGLRFYRFSKYMVGGIIEDLREELKDTDPSIHVASISPGLSEDETAYTSLQKPEVAKEMTNLENGLKPRRVASAVAAILKLPRKHPLNNRDFVVLPRLTTDLKKSSS